MLWLLAAIAFYANARAQEPVSRLETEGRPPSGKADSEQPLHLEDLIRQLLHANPDLHAARKRYEAALTRPSQQGALPDPRLTLGWIANGAPYPGAGLGVEPTSNIGFQVAQEIPFFGKRALKAGQAEKEAAGQAQSARELELTLVADLKEAFYDLRLSYESLDLIHEKQSMLQQLAKAAEIRYAAGEGVQQDIIRAGAEIAILETRMVQLEQRKAADSARINALLNRPPEADLTRPEPEERLPELEPFESLAARMLAASPMLGEQRALIDGRQLQLQSAQKSYYPDFDVMAGYYYQGAMKPMWEFKVQLNIPLFFASKQRPALEEAGALLSEAQRNYRAQEQTLRSRLRERFLSAQAAQKLMSLYSMQIVPEMQLAFESSLASYESGKLDLLSVLNNENSILEYQIGYREQRAEYLKALSEIEQLAGGNSGAAGASSKAPGEVRR